MDTPQGERGRRLFMLAVLDILQTLPHASAQLNQGTTMGPAFLLAFPLLLALSTPCNACECKFRHPQTYYCTSDIVVVGNILERGNDTALKRNYRINITQILKIPKKIPPITSVYTPKAWDSCGYEVRTSQQSELLIAGYLRRGALYFTRCHMVHFWYLLTSEQKLGFKALYRRGCKCQIQPCLLCWRSCPQPDKQECVWEQKDCDYSMWEGNQSLYSMCAPGHDGHCEWTRIDTVNYRPETTPPPETTPAMMAII
ncbi:metalloproteinase inhibitor 1-like [Cervus canadensis]|uniref:metalloproteinase inhibitor 1-like n=1 Tax=Cervus canadensis TaxID=1574408 RepID=UPI001CA338B0|nr:metalloproteinase inhibitor 1-like [Cervus canadensis]